MFSHVGGQIKHSGLDIHKKQFLENNFERDGLLLHNGEFLIQSDLWLEITGEKIDPSETPNLLKSEKINALKVDSETIIKNSKDRNGSRELQSRLENETLEVRNHIINILIPHAYEFSLDPCANFVIQKICDLSTQEQIQRLIEIFLPKANFILNHQSGCRVIHRLLERVNTKQLSAFYNKVRSNVSNLIRSQSGNHIVSRFVKGLPEKAKDIVEIISPDLKELISDTHGCHVVQLVFGEYDIDTLRPLINEVIQSVEALATNQYGNYIVQIALGKGTGDDLKKLLSSIMTHFYEFSVHKYASNVIEKCVTKESLEMFPDLFKNREEDIVRLMNNEYGNYVIQTVLQLGNSLVKSLIHEAAMTDENPNQYSRHVLSRLSELGFNII